MLSIRTFLPVLLAVSILFLGSCSTGVLSPEGTTTTILLIRHADRTLGDDNLNEKGRNRSQALLEAVSDIQIDTIYSPKKKRNQDTVRPLSIDRNIPITVIEPSSVAQQIMDKSGGKTVLWVGNTSNLDYIFNRLGGAGDGPNVYGDLFILTVSDKKLEKLEKKRFGGSGGL